MSKVKCVDSSMNKTKMRHALRRKETAKIKKSRMKKAYLDVYRWPNGYYIHDTMGVCKYENIVVPERKVNIYEYFFENGVIKESSIPSRKIVGYHIIPKHIERRLVGVEFVDITPRLYRGTIKKRQYKKIAQRRLRNSPDDVLYQGGDYKKIYSIRDEFS